MFTTRPARLTGKPSAIVIPVMTATPRMPGSQNGHNAIRATRERLGLSQAQLARACGMTQQAVHRLESQRSPFLEKLRRMARALKLPEQELIGATAHEVAAPEGGEAPDSLQRLDTALLRRVILFVEEQAVTNGGVAGHLDSPTRARLVCSIYEMALRDCAELDLDPAALELRRYLPVLDIALERAAA